MSVDIKNSPYAEPLPRPHEQHIQESLNYSRHYAQRIRGFGRSSKDSWIKRLWNHMFHKKNNPGANQKEREQSFHDDDSRMGNTISPSQVVTVLPPINNNNKTTVRFSDKVDSDKSKNKDGSQSAPARPRSVIKVRSKDKSMPASLQDSPYLPRREKTIAGKPAQKSHSSNSRDRRQSETHKYMQQRKPHPYLSSHADEWKPKMTRGVSMIQLEKRAKSTAEKAMKIQRVYSSKVPNVYHRLHAKKLNREREKYSKAIRSAPGRIATHPFLSKSENSQVWRPSLSRPVHIIELENRAKERAESAMQQTKIFSCEGPYPTDAYVRFALRKRGWVEKFNNRANMETTRRGQGSHNKLLCEDDDDFEAICQQDIPAPWEEEHGMYAIMSRIVRHYPARFIWGNRSVNNMVLRSEVIVNHFPKARYFSSKVGLTNSLRELIWLNSNVSDDFFPRCYTLSEDDKDDIIDDFRLTACMSLLRWVVKKCVPRKSTTEPLSARENSHYEEVIYEDNEDKDDGDLTERRGSEKQGKDGDVESDNNIEIVPKEDIISEATDDEDENVKEVEGEEEQETQTDSQNTSQTQNDEKVFFNKGVRRTLPNLKSSSKTQKKVEVSLKAVEWAILACEKFIACKNHEDIDNKKRGLSSSQWEQLVKWYYQISQENGRVRMTEGTLKESKAILEKMKHLWPQYELDGLRNLWIVKPGDKSKGIGIAFVNQLDDIQKYISNPTTQGTYVLQKYVERPLLIYDCKFDIRQWFLVTDFNPLTVWFYKESYLRICSQVYSYDTMHQAVHLSNVAVQQHYVNGEERNENLPENNFLTSTNFKKYLSEIGAAGAWDEVTYPAMKEAVINTLLATQDISESRKCAFELYGADFILTEDYQPWLLEINASPGMAPSSLEKAKLCAQVIEDTIKVVLDKREDRGSPTGNFELAFKDQVLPPVKCVDNKFMCEGQRIRKADLARYQQIDIKATKKEKYKEEKEKMKEQFNKPNEKEARRDLNENDKDESKDTKLDLSKCETDRVDENSESDTQKGRETEMNTTSASESTPPPEFDSEDETPSNRRSKDDKGQLLSPTSNKDKSRKDKSISKNSSRKGKEDKSLAKKEKELKETYNIFEKENKEPKSSRGTSRKDDGKKGKK